MIDSSLALLASIAAIIILLRLKLHPGLSIFIGSLILSLLVLPLHVIPELIYSTATNTQTLTLLLIIAMAMTLSRIMEIKGMLIHLADTMERIGPKLALFLTPSVIGFVPMPGGALVSATALRDLVKKLKLLPEQATFVNYWFRHIWEFFLPVYPAVITASVIFSLQLTSLMIFLLPMSILAAALGVLTTLYIIKPQTNNSERRIATENIFLSTLKAAWPVLLLITMVLAGLPAAAAFPITVVVLLIQQRIRLDELKQGLKYGLDPKILLMLFAVMLYKATIESSGAADELFLDMHSIGLPPVVILAILPFLISFSTGNTMAFVGICFPLLFNYVSVDSQINMWALLLAFISGEVGYLVSPLHLCLILSTQYFETNLSKVYRYIVPLIIVIEMVAILLFFLLAA